MIDRDARDVAALVLREFADGLTSTAQYEHRYPESRIDPAIWEIFAQVWFFYSDVKTHTLTGRHALNDARRAFVERCIVFLKSDVEFQWPRQRFRPWSGLLRLLGFGRVLRRCEEFESDVGDKDAWPFLDRAQFEAWSHQQFDAQTSAR